MGRLTLRAIRALCLAVVVGLVIAACADAAPPPAPIALIAEGHAEIQARPLAVTTALGEMVISSCTREIEESVAATRTVDLGAGPMEIPVVTFGFHYQAEGTARGDTPGGREIPIRLEQDGEVTIDLARLAQGQATNDPNLMAAAFTETSSMALVLLVPVDGGVTRELRISDQTPEEPDLQVIDGALAATFDTDLGTFVFDDTATETARQQQFCDWQTEIRTTAPGWYVALLNGA